MKPVTYSDHAEDRLSERRIGKNQVKRIVERPDTVVLQANGTIKVTGKTMTGRVITVVYQDRLSSHHIVTV